MSKNLIFLFILISLIELSKLQEVDKDMMRAVACLSLIRKLDNKPNDQRVLSTYILTCFITIDDSTAQKLIMSQSSNKLDLSQEQIEKLTNIYNVENKFTEDQIMDYSKALNDALERLKTYYTSLDKKASAAKIVNDMSGGNNDFQTLFNDEFIALTKIGNNYRIRHHETDKVDITDDNYYDYFFNRCLSLMALAIKYLQ